MQTYLNDTEFLNYRDEKFDVFTADIQPDLEKKDIAIALYYLVRDGFIYDPYHLDLTVEGLKASNVLKKKRAWCVEKSTVLAACARKFGIPSRLGYAIVTNHIGVDKLTNMLRREEIVFHGFVEMYLEEQWVKCTPAFDERICALTRVTPLEWDGESDSLFQEFEHGKKFMEYVHFYGIFDDVPIQLMNDEMQKYYPHLFEKEYNTREFSFKHL
jgi:transglutaminase-like putative cysteine protease